MVKWDLMSGLFLSVTHLGMSSCTIYREKIPNLITTPGLSPGLQTHIPNSSVEISTWTSAGTSKATCFPMNLPFQCSLPWGVFQPPSLSQTVTRLWRNSTDFQIFLSSPLLPLSSGPRHFLPGTSHTSYSLCHQAVCILVCLPLCCQR